MLIVTSCIDKNEFEVKKKKRLRLKVRVVVKTSNLPATLRFVFLRMARVSTKMRATRILPNVQHDYFSSFNQSYSFIFALSLLLTSSFYNH